MRRIAVIVTALIVLGGAAAAYAASQPYTGSLTFSNKKAGSVKKPNPVKFTLNVTANPTTGGLRPPVQLAIKLRIYGLKLNAKDFPTCSETKIATAKNDSVCPKKAMVATGYIQSLLGDPTDFTKSGFECDPILNVWNSGQGKLTYFFRTDATHVCANGALKTGDTAPYSGTYNYQGKYFVSNVPVPKYIDYPAGLAGSLKYEHLVFTTQTKQVKGKKAISQASIGCQSGKRPYQIITKTTYSTTGSPSTTSTISAKAPC